MTEPTIRDCQDRLAVSPAEAAQLAGVGRTLLYEALGSGALPSLKIGKRRLILMDALRAWLEEHASNGVNPPVAHQPTMPAGKTGKRYETPARQYGKGR
jgi:excisionase family DNA binding protein